MADCVSLPNVTELVERLRATAKVYYEDSAVLIPAADAIEALMQENAKLKEAFDECYAANEDLFRKLETMKEERDAAAEDIPRACGYCKHFSKNNCISIKCIKCMNISGVNTAWEWRGIKEES